MEQTLHCVWGIMLKNNDISVEEITLNVSLISRLIFITQRTVLIDSLSYLQALYSTWISCYSTTCYFDSDRCSDWVSQANTSTLDPVALQNFKLQCLHFLFVAVRKIKPKKNLSQTFDVPTMVLRKIQVCWEIGCIDRLKKLPTSSYTAWLLNTKALWSFRSGNCSPVDTAWHPTPHESSYTCRLNIVENTFHDLCISSSVEYFDAIWRW
jgi:hypothetical protein